MPKLTVTAAEALGHVVPQSAPNLSKPGSSSTQPLRKTAAKAATTRHNAASQPVPPPILPSRDGPLPPTGPTAAGTTQVSEWTESPPWAPEALRRMQAYAYGQQPFVGPLSDRRAWATSTSGAGGLVVRVVVIIALEGDVQDPLYTEGKELFNVLLGG